MLINVCLTAFLRAIQDTDFDAQLNKLFTREVVETYPFDVYDGGTQVFCYEFTSLQLQALVLNNPPLNYIAYQTDDDGFSGNYVSWSGVEWTIGSGGVGLPRKKKNA